MPKRLGLAATLTLALMVAGCADSDAPPEWFLGAWGSQGVRAGQFVKPRGLAVAPNGEVFCVDMTGRVQVFGPAGSFRASWMMPEIEIGLPEGLAVAADGKLLVADTHYSRVLAFAPDGSIAFRFGRPGTGPGEFTYPLAVAVDPAGHIYVTEYGGMHDRVQKFSAGGRYLSGWGSFGDGPGQFRRPSGVACDSQGFVYVADAVNHRVQKFDGQGALVAIIGRTNRGGRELGLLRYPYDVAVGPDDSLYVVEYGNQRVQRFAPDGRPLGVWGQAGAAPGDLFDPWCAAVNRRGDLYIADTGNHRIQRLRMPGAGAVAAGRSDEQP